MESSNSVENYIKGIYTLSGEQNDWVNTNHLAEKMQIKPSSVTDMLKKLDSRKLVRHMRYKGVKLTAEGNKLALRVIRNHRLWEVFLQQKLGFSWDEVHEIAEQLEHISSPELVSRLDKFLNFPQYDPHGDPIPNSKGVIKSGVRHLLATFNAGDVGKVVGVNDSTPAFLQFLESKKINLGCKIRVKQKFEYDHSMDVEISGSKTTLNLSGQVSQNLYLTKHE